MNTVTAAGSRARCSPTTRSDDPLAPSVTENDVAIGALIAGGATALAGTVLLFLNRPQSYRTEDRGDLKIEIRPAASLDTASLSARIVF